MLLINSILALVIFCQIRWRVMGNIFYHHRQRSFLKRRTDLAIGEFCRCDLADLKDFGDLACFKQLRCPSCTIRNPSVTYMRHHMLTHMAFTDAARFRIFDRDFDEADDTLGNLCTRLLNMNYSLVEECRSEPQMSQNSTEDEETQMPVLEKVTEMSDYSTTIPSLKISLHLAPSVFSSKSGDSLTSELFHPSTMACHQLQNKAGALQEYKDDYILAAPEEIVEWNEGAAFSEEPSTSDDPSEDAGEIETKPNLRPTERPCPYSKTLFFLSLSILPSSDWAGCRVPRREPVTLLEILLLLLLLLSPFNPVKALWIFSSDSFVLDQNDVRNLFLTFASHLKWRRPELMSERSFCRDWQWKLEWRSSIIMIMIIIFKLNETKINTVEFNQCSLPKNC